MEMVLFDLFVNYNTNLNTGTNLHSYETLPGYISRVLACNVYKIAIREIEVTY